MNYDPLLSIGLHIRSIRMVFRAQDANLGKKHESQSIPTEPKTAT